MNFAIIIVCVLYIYSAEAVKNTRKELHEEVKRAVESWSKNIGEHLTDISKAMSREDEVEKSFKPLENKLTRINGAALVQNIASDIRSMMDMKANAVKNISEYAEFLSYHRSNEPLFANSSYYFFNADNITDNDRDPEREEELSMDILESECSWTCNQSNPKPLSGNMFSEKACRDLPFRRRKNEKGIDCDCDHLSYPIRSPLSYLKLPMEYDERFEEKVNLNLSIAKIATNVFQREQSVLEGLRWSEPLDIVFKDNFLQDPTLTWQYFASPRGFMRHYPAIQWSDERYDKTYDFRTRTWYTEAITSPKDIIILLDRSGSIEGTRRALSMQIVNQILDTLNDNDFVNVYTFTNTTEPLVDCFKDTLVQANEENLRLLRENLPTYNEEFVADLYVGFQKAFDILENFRSTQTSAGCNQAIMIITEGIDYYYDKNLFKIHNADKGYPVRIFTYQLGDDSTDKKEMQWIACNNRGYWANMTDMGDIREKMLHYLNVMSRPINHCSANKRDRKFIWSYLHVDLADRRLSNWLWKKYEGIRQREVFLDHIKRDAFRLNKVLTSPKHMLLQDTHDYEKYEKEMKYKYMTTVSLPVYGRRINETELIGVAGVDVPIPLFKAQIPYHDLGVNGYAFIVTNNGYILFHPDHRTQFYKILKPTFNRVDFVEVEILDDDRDPRSFGESIVKLREKLVSQNESGEVSLDVKYLLNDMKRLMLAKRHYFYAAVGPFTLGIVLPDKYGFIKVDKTDIKLPAWQLSYDVLLTKHWKVHPEWIYCKRCIGNTPEEKVQKAFSGREKSKLLHSVLYDLEVTKWFDLIIDPADIFTSKYLVHKVFLATHSGLFRWKTLKNLTESEEKSFEDRNNEAIDEDWYRRAVEINFKNEDIFIYSVPFETSGYENNTVITSTKAIFVEKDDLKSPVAVVGIQFNHRAMYELYQTATKWCVDHNGKKKPCKYTCESEILNCFILDNNAYVVLSDEREFIGRYMGDIRPDVMSLLSAEHIYIRKRMYDYQAICQKTPPESKPKEKHKAKKVTKSSASRLRTITNHLVSIKNWLINIIYFFVNLSISSAAVYQSIKPDTLAFAKLAINKTFPTPCDHEMWLYNLNESMTFPHAPFNDDTAVNDCDWTYVVDRIPKSNLLFFALNGAKRCIKSAKSHKSPEPEEVLYNTNTTTKNALPCYIATMNNYTRRMYMGCFNSTEEEGNAEHNITYSCGNI